MNRRQLLERAAAIAGCAWVLPSLAEFQTAAASEAPCADCARLFDGEVVLPAVYARPVPEIMAMARTATHERALREGISHDEAALWAYWQGFPTYRIAASPEALTVTGNAVIRGGLTVTGAVLQPVPTFEAPDRLSTDEFNALWRQQAAERAASAVLYEPAVHGPLEWNEYVYRREPSLTLRNTDPDAGLHMRISRRSLHEEG